MEEAKPRLASEEDRELLCDAIEATRILVTATRRLAAALDLLAMIAIGRT
jgi:hypothetical protein